METRYTAVTICDRQKNANGTECVFQDVQVDTDVSFNALKDRHFRRHGIAYRAFYILDANGETIYSHAGFQDARTKSETEAKDEEYGYRDRKAGAYDKWYRVNRRDGGQAYDAGQARAAAEEGCPEVTNFIECL